MSGGKVVGYVQMEEGTPVAFSFQRSDATGCTEPLVLQSDLAAAIARAEAAERALVIAEAALADIGDADREPGDDLAWCERRAAQALPKVRAAIAAQQAEGEA